MPINLQKAEFILSAASPKDFIRDELPQVAFAGRSNVGKSSVINRLLNRKNLARVGAAPGKTTHINYFNIDRAFYLVDLPGYGYAKVSKGERDRWGKLMESYFADRSQMPSRLPNRSNSLEAGCICSSWVWRSTTSSTSTERSTRTS